MRKYFYLPLVLLVVVSIAAVEPASAARATNACYSLPAGLSGWWPGNGNTEDIVGGRDAVLHDDATTGPGLIGQAFVLDGDGDFVDVPHDPALNLGTGDFTVALWVLFDDTAGEQVLVEKWIQRGSDDSEGWTLTKLEGDVLRLAMASGDDTDTDTNVDSAPLTIPPGIWIHFAATRQDGEVTLLMNGQPAASGTYSGNLDSTASLKFGHRGSPSDTPGSEDDSGFYLNGRIDEVDVFVGHALPEASIRAIYGAGSLGKCAEDIIPDLPNLAAAKSVRASASWPEAPAQNAVDGQESAESAWIAGSHPPQWLEIDLQQPATVALVRLVTEQYPAGATVHEIWGAGPGEELRLLHEFRGRTDTNQVLAFRPEAPLPYIQLIRVLTTASPSWVAWREIEVYGSYDDPTSDINDSPPSENSVPVQPVTVAPVLPAAPAKNPVDTQVTVQMLYPRLAGAFIELQAKPLRPGLWTRLQWQDALGGWHDVEGWQGAFDEEQRVLWWVGEEHLGEGPFRWLVYESQGGDLLAVSEAFDLPSRGGEVLQVKISLPTKPPITGITALPPASQGSAPPVEKTITVDARAGWISTGFQLEPGNQVDIVYLSGLWTSGGTHALHDANGTTQNYICSQIMPASECGEPAPDAVQGSLIARIGDTPPFFIGNKMTFNATSYGPLMLSMNDTIWAENLLDNVGSIVVRVTVTREPTVTAAPAPASSQESTSSADKTITVDARAGWISTGLEVESGDQVEIVYLSGLWTSGGDHALHGANGTAQNYICSQGMPASECVEPVPGAVKGALVARIGNGRPFLVGNERVFNASSHGPLMLSMNDSNQVHDLVDNVGAIVVRVRLTGETAAASEDSGYLYDDFDNPAYDGSYDSTLWTRKDGCEVAAQSNGVIAFQSSCDLLVRPTLVTADQLEVFEARVKVADDLNGEAATQEIIFSTDDLPGGAWWAFCGIIADSEGIKSFFNVANVGLDEFDLHQTRPAAYDQWYTIRLEVDSDTMTFSCYVDNQLLGSVIPKDASLLKEARFERILEAARRPGSLATTYADDVRVTNLPQNADNGTTWVRVYPNGTL